MKKVVLLCLSVVAMMSCSSTKDIKSQDGIKGNWMITNVNYTGSDYIKVNSFNIADAKCFEGSMWNFVPNNNKGTMELAKSGCPAFSSPIVWTITKTGDFTLKITEGDKAKNVTQGYFLKVRNQTDNSFQLVDNVNVGGKNTEVVYQFVKQ
jgi:hypothetical protein